MESKGRMSLMLHEVVDNVLNGPLPTTDEIERMSFAEKQKLARAQDAIIAAFKQEALASLSSLHVKLKELQMTIEWLASDKTVSPYMDPSKRPPIRNTEEELQSEIDKLQAQIVRLEKDSRRGLKIGKRSTKR